MFIRTVEYELLDPLFYASRELGTVYMTEPILTSYGQPYALHWVEAPYRLAPKEVQRPRYAADLEGLNARGIYLGPASPVGPVRYRVERFNALTETYWYAMRQGVVASRLEHRSTASRIGAVNRPQQGQLRLVDRGTRLRAVLVSETDDVPAIPPYCRLGKFMSKARVRVERLGRAEERDGPFDATGYLNPADLPPSARPLGWDLVNVRPVPLLAAARFAGPHLDAKGVCVPQGLRYRFPEGG